MANEAAGHGRDDAPQTKGELSLGSRSVPPARRVYAAPRLTRLGEVRDLTFGTTGSTVESSSQRFPPGKGPPRH
jgi:hypothetical protein